MCPKPQNIIRKHCVLTELISHVQKDSKRCTKFCVWVYIEESIGLERETNLGPQKHLCLVEIVAVPLSLLDRGMKTVIASRIEEMGQHR